MARWVYPYSDGFEELADFDYSGVWGGHRPRDPLEDSCLYLLTLENGMKVICRRPLCHGIVGLGDCGERPRVRVIKTEPYYGYPMWEYDYV